MALITCPACGHDPVSDQAAACMVCGHPIATSTGAAGQEGHAVSARNSQGLAADGSKAIAELTAIVQQAQRSLLTPNQAQSLARQIVERKRASFSSREALLDASLRAETLILSDDDIDLLNELATEQKASFRCLYALGCDRVDDSMAEQLRGFRNLERLDVSYSRGLSELGMKSAFNGGRDLAMLEEMYFRACRRMTSVAIRNWMKHCKFISSVYLDGNPQLDFVGLIFVKDVPTLRLLSITECPQVANMIDGMRQLFSRDCPQLTIKGP